MDHHQEPAQHTRLPGQRAALMRLERNDHESHGYEILSDYQRDLMKMPKRGPDGWTIPEIIAWDEYRIAMMTRPLAMAVRVVDDSGAGSLLEAVIEESPGSIVCNHPSPSKEKP